MDLSLWHTSALLAQQSQYTRSIAVHARDEMERKTAQKSILEERKKWMANANQQSNKILHRDLTA